MFKVTITNLDNDEVVFEDSYAKEEIDIRVSRPVFICKKDEFSVPEKMITGYRTSLTLSGVSMDKKKLEELEQARFDYRIVTQSE